MRRLAGITRGILGAGLALACIPAIAAESDESYSPYAGREYPTQVFWGDTHAHSSWSPDAWTYGNRRLGPDETYRFARGEEVTAHNGMRVRLRRPLDFLVVSDHGEYLGLFPKLIGRDSVLLGTETGRRWQGWLESGEQARVMNEFLDALINNRDTLRSEPFKRSVWGEVVANADRHNEPGRFTAFIGYEWTSSPDRANLHRVVIFRDGAATAGRIQPFSSIDGNRPEDLWRFLAEYEERTGGRVLAIPHNSNMSAGLMFGVEDSGGRPLTAALAETRLRFERLVEATQVKGDSEAHPFLSPDDEFADYENWDETGGFGNRPHEDWMYRHEYVRGALGLGLDLERRLEVNPFQFGLIGSTDSHSGLATADESDFWGKFTADEPAPRRAFQGFGSVAAEEPSEGRLKWTYAASGYAAVWAQENTREDLFAAMQRRETYASTGPRMVVRFFGGWDFRAEDALAPDLASVGYRKGVPMGGELPKPPGDADPTFLVAALRDPDGANLDRIQIIKGWLDARGELHERIYDVAVSDGRTIAEDGRCREPVGTSVDVADASYTNSIGDPILTVRWADPDFDAGQRAFYYARVIEIPTPRWTAYDAKRFGVRMPAHIKTTTRERAYTSPIWYTPAR